MSNLTAKAKTTRQFYHELRIGDGKCIKEHQDCSICENEKWVPLEEAQKVLKEQKLVADSELESWKKYTDYLLKQKDGIIDRLNETIEHQENESINLDKKIAEANKILDEEGDSCPQKFKRLREVLR